MEFGKVNKHLMLSLFEKEISFQQEKLSEFKSIRHSLKDYLSERFSLEKLQIKDDSYKTNWQLDFIDAQYCVVNYEASPRAKKGYLDDFIQVLIDEHSNSYRELAEYQITGFEDFIKRRINVALHGVSEKETRLIRKIELAISFYRGNNCIHFYNKFKKALAEYFIWIERKIRKNILYIIHLNRFLSRVSLVLDYRQLLRTIMHFFCRRLDNEDATNNKSIESHHFFYCLKNASYEFNIYKSSCQRP